MPGSDGLKRFIGHDVEVDERDGSHHHGRLLNVNRRSIWIVEDEIDWFIPLDRVEGLHEAS
jgi:hypothetical protein